MSNELNIYFQTQVSDIMIQPRDGLGIAVAAPFPGYHSAITMLLISLLLLASVAAAASIYKDPRPINTTESLDQIRRLPLFTYRLNHEKSQSSGDERYHIGVLGPDVASVTPEAIDIRTLRLPSGEEIMDFPVVNEQLVLMRGVGATQELDSRMQTLQRSLNDQLDRVANLFAEVEQLEHLLQYSTDGKEELRIRAAAAEAKIIQAEMDLEIQRAKDEEEYLQATKEAELAQMKRSEELTLQRLAKEDEASRARSEEAMKIKLEASQKVERAKAQSAEALSLVEQERALKVEEESERMKIKTAQAIAEAKAQAERENEGLYLRRLKAQMEQARQRNLAVLHAIAGHIASSLSWAVQHPRQVFVFVGYLSLIFAAIYTAREAARLCRILIEASIGKPRLVRETTCRSFPRSLVSSVIGWCRGRRSNCECEVEEVFADVVLSGQLKERVVTLAKSARNAKRHDAPYRHVLLYGLPGTGKTMVAKKLAECTGLDYALMSGGDVGPLGPDAVTQIHALFRWAKMSRKGLLLFVDEAEAFLGNRKHCKMSENAHNALNALLYNTGGERRDFMLVLATNRAEDLDSAVLDRCDESLLFTLPDASCRQQLISQYFDAFVKQEVSKSEVAAASLGSHVRSYLSNEPPLRIQIDEDVMDDDQLQAIVAITQGFSGREIGKLMVALQASLYSSDTGKLTKTMVNGIVKTKADEHFDKRRMRGADDVPIGIRQMSDEKSGEEEKVWSETIEATPDPTLAREYGRQTLSRATRASGLSSKALFS